MSTSITTFKSKVFTIAQFSDCHLFATKHGLHYGVNVYQNLLLILESIKNNDVVDIAIFTGDLSQDHSEDSYQLFVEAIIKSAINIPVYHLAGNHDDFALLDKYLVNEPLKSEKLIDSPFWQIALLNSKGETPAGYVDDNSLAQIVTANNTGKHVLLCMHHHPIDVGFGIDKHGLTNKEKFWNTVSCNKKVKAVCCGHVHNGINMKHTFSELSDARPQQREVLLFTCPATSVEFDKASESVNVTEQGAGYQLISLFPEGEIVSKLIYFPANFV